jgi:hypothetical protein
MCLWLLALGGSALPAAQPKVPQQGLQHICICLQLQQCPTCTGTIAAAAAAVSMFVHAAAVSFAIDQYIAFGGERAPVAA